MLIIGLTGGIGSGKSVASDKFASLGITVVDADVVSRTVVEPGMPALKEIKSHFGSEIIASDGQLDRTKLREIIASDAEERKWLESVLLPRIGEQITNEISESSTPYTIFVAPLLLETNSDNMCSRVLVVDVAEEVQIQRTTKRDQMLGEQIEKIVAAQMSRKERLEKADDVLENAGTIRELQDQVEELHHNYLEMIK